MRNVVATLPQARKARNPEMTRLSHTLVSVLSIATALALVATAPRAEPPADLYGKAFEAWVAKVRPATAVAAVRRSGETLFLKGHNADPRAPSLIGSMSKPITGACIATLIRDGKLDFSTPLRDVLAGFFRRHGAPADRRLESVTIEQLLTHRSGLLGNDDNDPMQEIWRRRGEQGLAHLASPEALLVEHFKHPLTNDPGNRSSYTNTGFVVLSAAIEEVTGTAYETYCRQAVFAPLGIASARLHPDWRQFLGARGWIIAPADYLAFLDVFDPKHPFLGNRVKAWIVATETRWDKHYRGQFEGLGIVTAITSGGWRVLHSGILNFHGKGPNGAPIDAVIHSHAYREPNGFSAFHAMTPAVEGSPALGDLDAALRGVHDQLLKR
ncbi:MAG: beta-lactamase family protein [Xanthobacteraceae bacterium]|nr:beta-lactamase family protein [Xanthobacteraceae bacterium]